MSRKLMITVDVEAQPGRAERDHVRRLIWGQYQQGRAGVGEMMDVADRHAVKLTMFFDWAETDLYGECIRDAGREIHRRGHDLQLHAHANFFSPEFWTRNGIARQANLNRLNDRQAEAIVGEIVARQIEATGRTPTAFRGGGYRYSQALLAAVGQAGVGLDSSVNISRKTQPADLEPAGQFHWSNGVLEVPVSCVNGYRNVRRSFDFNFNAASMPDIASMHEYLEVFWQERGEGAIAVLVLHSWSLLKLGQDGYFFYDGDRMIDRLDGFLAGLAPGIEVVTADDIVRDDARGAVSVEGVVDLAVLEKAAQAKLNSNTETIKIGVPAVTGFSSAAICEPTCPICGAAKVRFVQLVGRKCPDCGALERQRSFAAAYDREIAQGFDLSDKKVLIFSPAASERRFMESRGIRASTSVDIRPEAKPDIVADICAMPHIADNSQELVFASYLMPVVHNLGAALDEVSRILKPDGVFISVEPVRQGAQSRVISEPEEQSRWYGREALEKYNVGSFRILGELDYLAALEQRFDVERFVADDPITLQTNVTYLCRSTKPIAISSSEAGDTETEAMRPVHANGATTDRRNEYIQEFRRKVFEHRIVTFDELDTSPKHIARRFEAEMDQMLDIGWEKDGVKPLSLAPPVKWDEGDRSFLVWLHSWEPLSFLLKASCVVSSRVKRERYFRASYAFARDWLEKFQRPILEQNPAAVFAQQKAEELPVWYDMAVGKRIYRLAFILDELCRDSSCSDPEIEFIYQSLKYHHEMLLVDGFFKSHSNHGFYQALGQLAAAKRLFNADADSRKYYGISCSRLTKTIADHFSHDNVHKEHSPGYHYMVLGSLIGAAQTDLIPAIANKRIAAMEEALAWMIQPDARLATFGDSDPRNMAIKSPSNILAKRYSTPQLQWILSRGAIGIAPATGVKPYHEAGYAFARLHAPGVEPTSQNASYLAQIAAFHSRVHKHADHLGFIWHDRGRDILIDPGRYAYAGRTETGSELFNQGFWYADPKRIYVESTRAHNCVEIDDTSYRRRGVTPFGSALRYAGEQDGLAVTDCEVTHWRTIRHRRVLVMGPGHFLLILDWLNDRTRPHDYRQWLQFAPEWTLEAARDRTIACADARGDRRAEVLSVFNLIEDNAIGPPIRGQEEPRLQGWMSDAADSLVPSTSLAVKALDRPMARFATLVVFGRDIKIDRAVTRLNATLRRGQVGWLDEKGSHLLTIALQEPGKASVQLRTNVQPFRAATSS